MILLSYNDGKYLIGGYLSGPIPTIITTTIKALIFIIIIIQQQSYQWVAGHDGQYNCHAFTFWGSGTTVTGITNTNVKSPQCLLRIISTYGGGGGGIRPYTYTYTYKYYYYY